VNQGFVLDHEKPPCDHADVVGMAGLITGTMIAFVFSAHFVTVACAVTRPKTGGPSGDRIRLLWDETLSVHETKNYDSGNSSVNPKRFYVSKTIKC